MVFVTIYTPVVISRDSTDAKAITGHVWNLGLCFYT